MSSLRMVTDSGIADKPIFNSLSFPMSERARSVKASAAVNAWCPEVHDLWRRGLGTAAESPTWQKPAEPFPVQPGAWWCGRSILVRHHYRYGRFRRVNVEGAAHGNQFDEARGAVVVTHIQRKRQAGLSGLRFADGKA